MLNPPKCPRWHWGDLLALAVVVAGVLLLFAGCATAPPIRLRPGECVVLEDKSQVIVAGSDCQMRRIYR